VYPHPYFANKILVFFGLRAGLRRKIVKTMKFPAKLSRERSYAQFRASARSFRLEGGTKKTHRDDDCKKDFRDHCATKQGNNLHGTCGAASRSLFARIGFVVSHPFPEWVTG
jgi:hypothetical protein